MYMRELSSSRSTSFDVMAFVWDLREIQKMNTFGNRKNLTHPMFPEIKIRERLLLFFKLLLLLLY